jgi:hypothetical protein
MGRLRGALFRWTCNRFGSFCEPFSPEAWSEVVLALTRKTRESVVVGGAGRIMTLL